MLNASGHLILPEFLPDTLRQPAPPAPTPPSGDAFDLVALIDGLLTTTDSQIHEKVIAEVERVLFTKVLQHTHGNQGIACDLLGLNRSTVRHRLRTLGLAVDKLPINKEQSDKP
jgi:two-component system nitrogen regulation response regulator GlnG